MYVLHVLQMLRNVQNLSLHASCMIATIFAHVAKISFCGQLTNLKLDCPLSDSDRGSGSQDFNCVREGP